MYREMVDGDMDNLDVHPRIINAVNKAKLLDYCSILSMSAPDLMRVTHLSSSDVNRLHKTVAEMVFKMLPVSALSLHEKNGSKEFHRNSLSTGCEVLDQFLRGGMISQCITEIAGESASGKTQLCMQLCLTAQLPTDLGGLESGQTLSALCISVLQLLVKDLSDLGAVYVCTEDVFPNRRLIQMVDRLRHRCNNPAVKEINFTDRIFIEHASDLDDLWFCVNKKIPVLLARGLIRLIVIDSIAALFRCEFSQRETFQRAKQLSAFAAKLLHLSTKYNIPVICVNQVSAIVGDTSAPSDRKVVPALGLAWSNLVTVRLMLSRTETSVTITDNHAASSASEQSLNANVRTLEVMFAPHLPMSLCYYTIDQDGVKGLR